MIIVTKLHIKVEKKKTKAKVNSSFKKVFSKDQSINFVISISFIKSINKNKKDCKTVINKIVIEKPKNFHKIKSVLVIGLLKFKKIVFHSISLNKSWLQINKTQISQKISIAPSQKSITIYVVSQIVNFCNNKEKNIKITQKITIM